MSARTNATRFDFVAAEILLKVQKTDPEIFCRCPSSKPRLAMTVSAEAIMPSVSSASKAPPCAAMVWAADKSAPWGKGDMNIEEREKH